MSDTCRTVRDCCTDLSFMARLLAFALASRDNGTGTVWPSVRQMCEDTSMGRTSVFKALAELVAKGKIKRIDEHRNTAGWELHFGAPTVRRADDSTPTRHPDPEPNGAPDRSHGEPSHGDRLRYSPSGELKSFAARTDGSRGERSTVRGADGGSAMRTGSFAVRTRTVRNANGHLEVPTEVPMKGPPSGGAVPVAPPPGGDWLTEDLEQRIRLADPGYRGVGTAASEAMAASRQLAEAGFDPAERAALMAVLGERWAAAGHRPSAVLRLLAKVLDPADGFAHNASLLNPCTVEMAGEARCG